MTALRTRLMTAMAPQQTASGTVWGNPRLMTEGLRQVRSALGDRGDDRPAEDRLQRSLQVFADRKRVANFTELKHVCYGVTVPLGTTRLRVIDQPSLFDRLLVLVEALSGQPRQFRRCYQGLLESYFGFDRYAQPSAVATETWHRLRGFLSQSLARVWKTSTGRGEAPDWLKTLRKHENLLTDDPCSRYAKALREGSTDELQALCDALGIAGTSWVWEEALMAYVQLVCDQPDAAFLRHMPAVLRLINGESDLKLVQTLATKATAMTISRYARTADHPEQTDLRDACLRWIGNPWVNRLAWDAHVKSEPARQMVEGWLKRHLIKNFFQLLAHDGAADLRRLNYWLKWESQITDMWFVLGSDAARNRSEPFLRLRKLMEGRERYLLDSTDDNNAFVMRIGPLLVIEFGVTNNACFVYAASDFRVSLDQRRLSVHLLKQRSGAKRLSHNFGWETRFDQTLRELLGSVPQSKCVLVTPEAAGVATRPAAAPTIPRAESGGSPKPPWPWRVGAASGPNTVPKPPVGITASASAELDKINAVRTKCVQHGIEWEDNRSKKGAFWVLMPDRNKHVEFVKLLDSLGFRYTPGQGYWIK